MKGKTMNGHTIILLIISISIFGCAKSKDKFSDETPTEGDKSEYVQLSQAVVEGFTIGGFGVISRQPDGQPEHQGEALIWGGTFLWSAPCDVAESHSVAMAAMLDDLGGQLIRVDPLGEYENGRQITLDGAIGFLLGVSRRITDCGESDLWSGPIAKMLEFQNSNGDRMNSNASAKLVGEFKYMRDLIASRLRLRYEPDDSRKKDLEKIVGGWPGLVRLAHETGLGSDACFRVNLSLSTLITMETLGKEISQDARNQFCENSKSMDIPTVDHWCGRSNITGYLSNYQIDQYEYRHQRCKWESADGDGNTSHSLDKIIAYVFANGWKNLQN